MTFTVRELLSAAVSESDNTAVDVLLRVSGGPAAVTQFLHDKGIANMRIDMGEAGFARILEAIPKDAPAPARTANAESSAMRDSVAKLLADPPNPSTPKAAALFLTKLYNNQLLSPGSTHYLMNLMYLQTTPHRLRDGIPGTARLADKTGTAGISEGMTLAWNDIGIITWPDGHSVIIAAFWRIRISLSLK